LEGQTSCRTGCKDLARKDRLCGDEAHVPQAMGFPATGNQGWGDATGEASSFFSSKFHFQIW